ncbi:hypothetical protein K2Z83_20660 [Oscillochloris sp. ZM17-4]|uniref:hypothetical protein n=1 Tax=Oscillochloris sp. ZM17-4 TaxID=2866714 RepID=UPI001C7359FE|nr:hypothetical protein [Oscillochloris sp. ZM17-4]MBX0330083.1 hypothetical protein [Oscillochloris sp. ZM17-4]
MINLILANRRPATMLDMTHLRASDPRLFLWIVKAALAATKRGETVTWGRESGKLDADAFRALLREALDYQISARGGPLPSWRKLETGYQRQMRQDAYLIRHGREVGQPISPLMIRTPELVRCA